MAAIERHWSRNGRGGSHRSSKNRRKSMKKVGLFPARLGSRALVAAVAAAGLPAAGQMSSQNFAGPYDPTISVTLGGVVNRFDTSVRLDGQTQRGTDFALED